MERRSYRLVGRPFAPAAGMVLLAAALLAATHGCSVLATAMWVVKGGETVDAKYDGLKHQRVVVVCRGPDEIKWRRDARAPQELARQIGKLLKDRLGKKIEIVDPDRVAKFCDEQRWDDFTEVGEALEADVVLGIDLVEFGTSAGQTVRQGRADLTFTVHEVASREKPYTASVQNVRFPTMGPVSASDRGEDEFRGLFVRYLAEHVARHFYSHDPSVDFANNSLD